MYTGHVEPGGQAAIRELETLVLRKLSVGSMDNNAYLLTSRATGAQLLVDAADDAPALLALIAEGSPRAELDVVVTTHQHWDHHRALRDVVRHTGARSAAGRQDAGGVPVPPGQLLDNGSQVTFGDVTLDVISLRGHTPGSVALLYREPGGGTHLLTGDSLFPGGPGRTANPKDFTSLMDDLEERVFGPLPDSTWFYPGHGDDSTLGAERPQLSQWRDRGW